MTARIDPQAIKEKLTTETLGRSVVFREETASTNADAKALGRQGAPHGTRALRPADRRARQARQELAFR